MSQNAPDTARLLQSPQQIDFLAVVLILAGTWLAIVLVRKALPWIAERGPSRARLWLLSAVPLFRLLAIVAAILWIAPLVFNLTLENFLVMAGAASVAIGFAFKDYASSLIAGIVAQFERPWRPGDWIRIGDHYGEVRSVGMRALVVQTLHDDSVHIPHLKLWDSAVSNANDGARTLMCVADFYLASATEVAPVSAALHEVALTSAWLDYDQPVFVFAETQPWGLHLELRAYPFEMRDQGRFKTDLTMRGKAAIRALGAEEIAGAAAAVES